MTTIGDVHKLKIAEKTLKMNDTMAKIMGGMTKEEARELLDIPETKQKKKWLSPRPLACELCGAKIIKQNHFIDGKTTSGPWAIMCMACFFINGVGLGSGRGQRYDVETLEKVEG